MKIVKALSTLFFLFPLVSCAMEPKPSDPTTFYHIDEKGDVVAVNEEGERVKLEQVKIPFKHNITEIKSIEHLTIIEMHGSHFRLVCTSAHRCYYQPLAH
ncbi:MAG: hypothetical protein ABW096_00735 [Candidatus Thiodiazotropha sp.]